MKWTLIIWMVARAYGNDVAIEKVEGFSSLESCKQAGHIFLVSGREETVPRNMSFKHYTCVEIK